MAGGSHKTSSNKPHPSSSSSSRKSRWESNAGKSNPPSDTKSAPSGGADDFKSITNKPSSNPTSDKPTPKRPLPNPSPAQQKPQNEPVPHSGAAGPVLPPGLPLQGPDSVSMGPPPPPPPSYGFHMLDRRTIVLADGSVRSYFALPPDYQDFVPPPRPLDPMVRIRPDRFPMFGPMSPDGFRDRDEQFGWNKSQDYWKSLGLDGRGGPEGSMKRKYGEEEERVRDGQDELARKRQQLLQYANVGANLGEGNSFLPGTSSPFRRDEEFRSSKYVRTGGGYDNVGLKLDVDPAALKKAFLHFVKLINENANQRKNYLENGKHGPLQCIACGRSSKDFPDMHGLIIHTYSSDNADLRVEHLGLHKALCVLMGWNYFKAPDNSKAYQFLPAEEAATYQDDLIMWPPTVIIHNTNTGKGKDGRMEGLGNKAMDSKMRDLGFGGGKSKSLYGRDGHLGITLIKFAADQSGLREAMRLADHFEKENRGRKGWARLQPTTSGNEENNPNLVKVDERTGEKKRVFYGYLATASDLEKVDFETRKKVVLESKQEYLQSK
ncbi:hypothetical protein Nepgr_010272 [Nepenthes gracilis]|uniref:XS domain-containing protein n=1 Tax=Nepenthes gracilis TaxID=150966 RepID=A0AAD3SD33_NEPGR|nr:hypothetical protein Nepgr_010272 [Nepenthes gracilis]